MMWLNMTCRIEGDFSYYYYYYTCTDNNAFLAGISVCLLVELDESYTHTHTPV